MNLVLFDDALDHLTRVHRVIRMDQGHALLVGVGKSKIRFYDHQKYLVVAGKKRNPPFLHLKIITRDLLGKFLETVTNYIEEDHVRNVDECYAF